MCRQQNLIIAACWLTSINPELVEGGIHGLSGMRICGDGIIRIMSWYYPSREMLHQHRILAIYKRGC